MAVKQYTLSNGARVVIDEIPHVQSATVGFYFTVGARHEGKKNNGAAHFLEHMAFKGTATRDARRLATEVADMGADSNAFTGKDSTCYYIKGLAEDAGKFIDILGDIVMNSTLPPDELERERGAIIEEIGGYKDDPDSVAFENLEKTAYPGQPYGASILGPADNIRNMTREQLQAFMRKHYHAGNLIVSVAGKVDAKEILAKLEETIGAMPSRPKSAFRKAVYSGGAAHDERPLEQLRAVFTFKSYPLSDPRYWSAQILADILGGGMSSRLFHEIREKRGLVYGVSAFQRASTDAGTFNIYAGTGPEKIATLIPVLCDELKKIKENGVTPEELARSQKQMQTRLATQGESVMNRMLSPARSLQQNGRIVTEEEVLKAIKAVTADSVKAAANEIFAGKMTMSTVGPGKNVEAYEKVSARLKI